MFLIFQIHSKIKLNSLEVTQEFDLKIDVYSLGGRRIKSIEKFNLPAGFNVLDWNGLGCF